MKVYILGKSRGLGYELGRLFELDEYQVIGIDRSTGVDLETEWMTAIENIEEGSLIILNAYAAGSQKKTLESLINRNNKIVVMGSIAARYPDPNMAEYSKNKLELDNYFIKHALDNQNSKMLILNLTGKTYQDSKLIFDSIKFWLVNTDIIAFSYRTK
jgi:short-subunit dehydrogenase